MGSHRDGGHQYSRNVASDNARMYNGDMHGPVHIGDNYYQSEEDPRHDQAAILRSLEFPGMDSSVRRPLESFPGTSEWLLGGKALHNCDTCRDRSNTELSKECKDRCLSQRQTAEAINQASNKFNDWLQKDVCKPFWISGKAGSGKSTLMKFLSAQDIGGSNCRRLTCFAWAAGTSLQKSHEGMLRALLHQLMLTNPTGMLSILPSRWRQQQSKLGFTAPWTVQELRDAVKRALANSPVPHIVFIDGLDEFDEESIETVRLIGTIFEGGTQVKLCISSRPWNIFRAMYGEKEHLNIQLEDLNAPDLDLYIREKFLAHPNFCSIQEAYPTEVQDLLRDIRTRAEGVFLWVYLTVRNLERGLNDYDSIEELRVRLEHIPTDLDDFIRRIINGIEPQHRKYMARSLLLLRANLEVFHRPLMWFAFLQEDERKPCLALEAPLVSITSAEIAGHLRRAQSLVNKWCRDLVTISPSVPDGLRQLSANDTLQDKLYSLCAALGYRHEQYEEHNPLAVSMFHRSIWDAVRSCLKGSTLQQLAGTEFDVYATACNIVLRLLKLSSPAPGSRLNPHLAIGFVEDIASIASAADSLSPKVINVFSEAWRLIATCNHDLPTYFLADLEDLILLRKDDYLTGARGWVLEAYGADHLFWSLMPVPHSLEQTSLLERQYYFESALYNHILGTEGKKYPSIRSLIRSHTKGSVNINEELIESLSKIGVAINDSVPRRNGASWSIWQRFLIEIHSSKHGSLEADVIRMAEYLLELGGDPMARLPASQLYQFSVMNESDYVRAQSCIQRSWGGFVTAAESFDWPSELPKDSIFGSSRKSQFARIRSMLSQWSSKQAHEVRSLPDRVDDDLSAGLLAYATHEAQQSRDQEERQQGHGSRKRKRASVPLREFRN